MFEQYFAGKKWLAEPRRLHELFARVKGMRTLPSPPVRSASMQDRIVASSHQGSGGGQVAIVHLCGLIEYRCTEIGQAMGFTSAEQFGYQLQNLADNPSVGAILIRIDSPGGESTGIKTLSDQIYALSKELPIIGQVDQMACSAAYWLGTSCTALYGIEDAEVGSVGVYTMHVDYSQALKDEGINLTLIGVPEHKIEGNPYNPLSAETVAQFSQSIQETYSDFVRALARNNDHSVGRVQAEYGRGRVVGAKAALAKDMIDGICTSQDAYTIAMRAAATGKIPARKSKAAASAAGTSRMAKLRADQARRREIEALS